MNQGTLLHIHTSVRTGRPMVSHQKVTVVPGKGIAGDRYFTGSGKYSRSPGVRDITLFEIETIDALKNESGIELLAKEHRRNLTTEGVVLSALIGQTFTIGEVRFEGVGRCNSCRYLNIMSKKQISVRLADRAGLFCRVVTGGELNVGDPIDVGLPGAIRE